MKYLAVIFLVMALMISMAYAEDLTTSDATWDKAWMNKIDCFDHTHQYQAPDEVQDPLGVGVDVKVYKFSELNPLDSVNIEGKYDVQNNGYSAYAVLHLDLTTLYQDKK